MGNSNESEGRTPPIEIRSMTWGRDSHGLFDYESKKVYKRKLKSQGCCKINRNGNTVIIQNTNTYISKNDRSQRGLAQIFPYKGKLWVAEANECTNSKEKLWIIVKYSKKEGDVIGHKLHKGDLLKFGRVRFRIIELVGVTKAGSVRHAEEEKTEDENVIAEDLAAIGDESSRQINSPGASISPPIAIGDAQEIVPSHHREDTVSSPRQISKDKQALKTELCGTSEASRKSEGPICRICLSEENTLQNPLFSPCRCMGTAGHIHLDCLREWLKSKVVVRKLDHCVIYSWLALECELCKMQYPEKLKLGNLSYDLVDIETPPSHYLRLETANQTHSTSKAIYLIKMADKQKLKMGRGHESDIRINDISVSRYHASLTMKNDEFYLADTNSKFGTLVEVNRAFSIRRGRSIHLQSGRSVLVFSYKESCQLCCSAPYTQADDDISSIPNSELMAHQEEVNINDYMQTSVLGANIREQPTLPNAEDRMPVQPPQSDGGNFIQNTDNRPIMVEGEGNGNNMSDNMNNMNNMNDMNMNDMDDDMNNNSPRMEEERIGVERYSPREEEVNMNANNISQTEDHLIDRRGIEGEMGESHGITPEVQVPNPIEESKTGLPLPVPVSATRRNKEILNTNSNSPGGQGGRANIQGGNDMEGNMAYEDILREEEKGHAQGSIYRGTNRAPGVNVNTAIGRRVVGESTETMGGEHYLRRFKADTTSPYVEEKSIPGGGKPPNRPTPIEETKQGGTHPNIPQGGGDPASQGTPGKKNMEHIWN